MTNRHFLSIRCFYFALFLIIPISGIAVENTDTNLIVSTAIPSNNGLLVGFNEQPTGCAGNFNSMHAFLPKTLAYYNKYSVALLRNRALKQTVSITYIDKGDCTTLDSVLEITAIQ